ncbi:MAG: sulfite exporter TauE/SafE family protein [Flavobacteriales bacterium]|nr:sulfite exporter TauE/SafE family protein [Flavobacteriales bacterium]MCC6938436.1 sulfite exporter TauE/SafE family protein [Flavobacteriales bacterium]
MEILGYIGAVLMGVTLGLMGGGGSILTVPILVYLFRLDMYTATMYSLFIVGLVSAVGGVRSLRNKVVDPYALVWFGVPSVISVLATRAWLLPGLPDPIIHVGGLIIGKSLALLLLFAVLMLVASLSMIRRTDPSAASKERRPALLASMGLGVGLVTGLLGAGGGFLIIPALVLFARLEIHRAIGTSLILIATNALIGFVGDLWNGPTMDVRFLAVFSGLAIVGVLLGGRWSERIPNEKLKPAFGWFVLVMGIYIIGRELSAMA